MGEYLDFAADAMCTWLSRDGGATWEDVAPHAVRQGPFRRAVSAFPYERFLPVFVDFPAEFCRLLWSAPALRTKHTLPTTCRTTQSFLSKGQNPYYMLLHILCNC